MTDHHAATEGRWQFSLRSVLLLTLVVAAALASWHYLRFGSALGLPIWTSLVAVAFSRRSGLARARAFVIGYWVGYALLRLSIFTMFILAAFVLY